MEKHTAPYRFGNYHYPIKFNKYKYSGCGQTKPCQQGVTRNPDRLNYGLQAAGFRLRPGYDLSWWARADGQPPHFRDSSWTVQYLKKRGRCPARRIQQEYDPMDELGCTLRTCRCETAQNACTSTLRTPVSVRRSLCQPRLNLFSYYHPCQGLQYYNNIFKGKWLLSINYSLVWLS